MNNRGGKFEFAFKPLLLLAGFFIVLFAGAASAQARTNIYAPSVDITTPTTWTVAGSPYVISGWAWLDITSTLTIDAGVVVKFAPDHFNQRYNGLNVSGGGKIIANGTGANPIIFTSYYDDTASGDTNGDGSASAPVAGDWRGIILDADASELSHVEVRYGANIYQSYGGIEIKNNSTASLSDVSIKYSAGSALRLNQPASPSVTNIIIDTCNDYGIYSTIAGSNITITNATISNCADGVAVLSVANTLAFTNATVTNTKPVINLTGSSVSGNATWPKIGSVAYILDNDIGVPTGITLTIAPGVVVKGEYGAYPDSRFEISGRLLAQGTVDQPIVFTSLRDDTVGGDSNNDGIASAPAAGDWGGLYFENSANSTLNYITVRYGGNYADDFNGVFYATTDNVMLHLKNSSLAIATSTIGLANTAIYMESASGLTMSGSTVATTTTAILSSSSLASTISNTSFINNTHFAISNTGAQIDGRHNWWGDDSGPTIAGNPGGTGNSISSNVLYSPWTVHIPPNQTPTLSYIGTSGYVSDGVEPNISFKNSTLPVFKVLYSDAENTVSYVRLVTASSTVAMATSTGGIYDYTLASGTFDKGTYSYHFEASDGVATARLPASGELSFEVKNIPIILVPGIMGTEMKKGDDLLWPNIGRMFTDFGDDFMNVLSMNSDGTPIDNQVVTDDIVRQPVITKDVFKGLIDQFINLGYQEDIDLFVLPYDWRLDIRTTSESLKSKINSVKSQTGSSIIDIVAHSMGGLLAKQYALDNGSNSIDKLIFVGTPHLGAPKATKTLLLGDDLGVSLVIPFLDFQRIKHISQNMSAIYELLPSQLYVAQNGSYYSDLTTNNISFTYSEMGNYFVDQGLNSGLIQAASSFHSMALDDFNTAGIDVYNINGCNTPTISSIKKFRGPLRDEYLVSMSAGDGTVPIESSKAINVDSSKAYYFSNTGIFNGSHSIEHAEMPSTDGIRELITEIITGANIVLPDNATHDSSLCEVSGQFISVHSPVNLHIYDQDGNHVGRGENGDIDYNITGVAYEEIGENKFVFLPTSGGQTYQVTLDGTGSGTFSLRVSKVENNEITETAYYSNLPVNTATEATVTLASSVANTVLQVDQNGTNNFTPVSVSAVLNSTQAADIVQPASAITVSGSSLGGDRYQTSATVSLSSTDDNAGILKTEYSLNNGSTWNTYSNSFIITALGSNTIQYRATDRAGNVETTKSKTIEIVATPNAVILISPSGSSNTEVPKQNSNDEPAPQVLGEVAERPANEQYTKDEILNALALADTDKLLDYLGKIRDTALETKVGQDYGKYLVLDKAATNFITYGTKSTDKLGLGERAGVLRSYQYAFGKLPQTAADWQDAVNIATNQLPIKRSKKAEQEARAIVRKIYGGLENQSVMMIAYGLRPETRDIKKEQTDLSRFGRIFGKMPSSVFDWNIFRKLVY